jgi:predicted RNase H-like HicB family nuclease
MNVVITQEENGYLIEHQDDEDIYAFGDTIDTAFIEFFDVYKMIHELRAEHLSFSWIQSFIKNTHIPTRFSSLRVKVPCEC